MIDFFGASDVDSALQDSSRHCLSTMMVWKKLIELFCAVLCTGGLA